MATDLYLIVASIFTMVLLVTLIAMLVLVQKSISGLLGLLRSVHHEIMPLMADLRSVSLDLAEASAELRTGMQKVNRVTTVLAGIGDDVDDARLSVRQGLENARAALDPWMQKLRELAFRLKLGASRREEPYV